MNQRNKADFEDLVFRKQFRTSMQKVWQVWMDPALLRQWWGPHRFICSHAQIDFREGGRSVLCMQAPEEFGGAEHCNSWTYEKIRPFEQILFVSRFCKREGIDVIPTDLGLPAEMPEEILTEVKFAEIPEGVRVEITEYRWPEGDMRKLARQGMEECLEKMEQALNAAAH